MGTLSKIQNDGYRVDFANGAKAKLATAGSAEREGMLLAMFQKALDAAGKTADAVARAEIVQDARALNAMASAYRVSAETQRKIGEATIRLMRLFGASLTAMYPRAANAELQAKTGIPSVNCRRAINLATYTEDDLEAAFLNMKAEDRDVGIEITLGYLRANDPRFAKECEDRERRVAAKEQEAQASRERDPDYAELCVIWQEFRNYWDCCREILRLRRELERRVA